MDFRSPIDIQLPQVPAGVPDDWVPIFQSLFNAIRTLQIAIGDTSGNSFTDLTYFDQLAPTASQAIQVQNMQMFYGRAKGAITKGNLVGLVNDAGTLKVQHALAAAGATQIRAIGWAAEAIADGTSGAIYIHSGYNPNFTALTFPTVFYLSDTTPGAYQSTKPVGAGKIVQEVGISLSATEVLMKIGQPTTL